MFALQKNITGLISFVLCRILSYLLNFCRTSWIPIAFIVGFLRFREVSCWFLATAVDFSSEK